MSRTHGHDLSRDTIAAVATPPGVGGVGVVRLSGPSAAACALRVFQPSAAGFSGFYPRYMHHGRILAPSVDAPDARIVDEVLAVHFPAPNSFTGEDVVEIHGHGGPLVVAEVLRSVLSAGNDLDVREARPGEFSKRAFLNGKMDLVQAEAVAEAVAADSPAGLALAQTRLAGGLGHRVADLRDKLEALRIQLCIAVDFPDEDVECLPPDALTRDVCELIDSLQALAGVASRRRVWEEGGLVVLAGRVNAGKSSLLNAIAGSNRAIVTDRAGTTRDYLEERLLLDGLPVTLVDTAGLRADGELLTGELDPIEAEGVSRSRSLAARADLLVLVLDGARQEPLAEPERELLAHLDASGVLIALNKVDTWARYESTTPRSPLSRLADTLQSLGLGSLEIIPLSAAQGVGVDDLTRAIRRRLAGGDTPPRPGELAPNLRQARAMHRAAEELDGLLQDLDAGIPYDVLGVRLETASHALAEITGAIASHDVLNAIFDSFCIGK
ncbi:tRNA uridine-5-carboxymethylaminomethyl(34) synthesis GTPase MnmE [Oceanidesulfovibrio marinus]|uniref:tRNA modification GTPase MnmE n=1 Tax=Oceanidesulfovibrio marinus TaxID=370038 RepID=A0A6P1ZQJ9_9BACT|nr:tRNA uridine-5-carboxymethylaminomethyl(34) synthesis GTPase MnmE [Oceanidesulfovibrio marinus]TVM36765.1 tRNA uridine-5-carboxymethylaminomethyl(34) synthesis GTPase MnmE [Oceanidesulfovibrio marinus]